MKHPLLVAALIAIHSLHFASAEELMIPPDSDLWKHIYEPDATEPVEIATDNPLRKKLFNLARPKLEKSAGQPILFSGTLKGYRNWALFQGSSVDKKGDPLSYPDDGTSDTVALFLRTVNGWVLVDCSGGHSDVFYQTWTEQYGMPFEILRY